MSFSMSSSYRDPPSGQGSTCFKSQSGKPLVFAMTDHDLVQITPNLTCYYPATVVTDESEDSTAKATWTEAESMGPFVSHIEVTRSTNEHREDRYCTANMSVRDTPLARYKRRGIPLQPSSGISSPNSRVYSYPQESGYRNETLKTVDGEVVTVSVGIYAANRKEVDSKNTAQLEELGITSRMVDHHTSKGRKVYQADSLILGSGIAQTLRQFGEDSM